jgi:hypothetical protein
MENRMLIAEKVIYNSGTVKEINQEKDCYLYEYS